LPELKIRPFASGSVTRTQSKKASADAGEGGNYAVGGSRFPAFSGAPAPEEGVKAGDLYYKPGATKSQSSGNNDDDDDDDNAKGGLIRKVKGPKPKGSKDDGKITAQRGEFVMKKAAVQKHGVKALNALNAGKAKIVMAKPAPKRKK
jgi:hypothetical protein